MQSPLSKARPTAASRGSPAKPRSGRIYDLIATVPPDFYRRSLLFFGMGRHRIQDPLFLRELSGLELGVDKVPVDRYLEATPARRNQLQIVYLLFVGRQQLARQTDGLRFVVSNRTILELQMHTQLPSRSRQM